MHFYGFFQFKKIFKTFADSLWHFGTPISNGKKRNEVTGHMKHAAMAVTSTLGKLM